MMIRSKLVADGDTTTAAGGCSTFANVMAAAVGGLTQRLLLV